MIYLTEAAAARIRRFMNPARGDIGVYLDVIRSGCSGYGYHVDFIDEIKEGQQAFECLGITIVVDQEDLAMIDGLTMDVKKQGLNEFFSFDNPQAVAVCGCGTSFNTN